MVYGVLAVGVRVEVTSASDGGNDGGSFAAIGPGSAAMMCVRCRPVDDDDRVAAAVLFTPDSGRCN